MNRKTKAACDFFLGIFLSVIFASGSAAYEEIAVNDKGGNYRLNGVPLGKYRIQVWHPELGITETGVELVSAGEVLDVNFDLKKK